MQMQMHMHMHMHMQMHMQMHMCICCLQSVKKFCLCVDWALRTKDQCIYQDFL